MSDQGVPQEIRVRVAQEADHLELVELWIALGAAGRAADPRYRLRSGVRPSARAFIAESWLGPRPSHRVWVASDSRGRIVGYVAARVADPHLFVDQDTTLIITDAFVAEDARRRGVGRALVREVQAHARAEEVRSVEVGTLALDERALAFWRSLGFGDWRVTLRCDSP